MAQRIWFPLAPVSGISASDRAQIGIGYGGLVIAAPAQVAIRGARKIVRDDFIPRAVKGESVSRAVRGEAVPHAVKGESIPRVVKGETVPHMVISE